MNPAMIRYPFVTGFVTAYNGSLPIRQAVRHPLKRVTNIAGSDGWQGFRFVTRGNEPGCLRGVGNETFVTALSRVTKRGGTFPQVTKSGDESRVLSPVRQWGVTSAKPHGIRAVGKFVTRKIG